MDDQLYEFLNAHLTNLTLHYLDGYHPTRFEYEQYSIGLLAEHSYSIRDLALKYCTILKEVAPSLQIEVIVDFRDKNAISQALVEHSDVQVVAYPRDVKVRVDTYNKFIVDLRTQDDKSIRSFVHFQGPSQSTLRSAL